MTDYMKVSVSDDGNVFGLSINKFDKKDTDFSANYYHKINGEMTSYINSILITLDLLQN